MNLTGTVCRCLSPRKIVNPYTSESLIVPCGHCKACALNRASHLTLLCDLEKESNEYCVFITLTYANRYIPRAQLVESATQNLCYDLVEKKTGEILGTVPMSMDFEEKFLRKLYLFGDVPYLRKEDLQKFFKRFRYYAKKTTKSPVRYFAAGEYGPAHFRPHFHILLFFNDKTLLQTCNEIVCQAWPFGRVDVQLVQKSASSYVAGYVNSVGTLPKVFKIPSTRPFCVHSQRLGFSLLARPRKEVYAQTVDDFIRRGLTFNGKYREFNLWRSAYSFYFPKCRGFANKSSRECAYSYRIYDTARQIYPEAETTFQLAKEIVFDIFTFGSAVNQYDSKTRDLFRYFIDYSVTSLDSDIADRWVHRVYTELLISKHFLEFVCDHRTVFEINRKVSLIKSFYSRLDYLHLTDFFQTQLQFFADGLYGEYLLSYSDDNDYYPYMYDNVDWSQSSLRCTPAYRIFDSQTQKLFDDRMKHKKQNDLNKIFIYN